MFIIHEGNYWDAVRERDQRSDGMVCLFERAKPMGMCAVAKPFAETHTLIPKSEIPDRINEMTKAAAWVNDRRRALSAKLKKSVVKDQNGLGYCHLYALANCVEDRLDAMGQFRTLAPETGGGVVGWRNRGGNMDSDLEYVALHGLAEESFLPSPHCIDPNRFKEGWEQNALCHVPLEWDELGHEDMWWETMTALLEGLPVYPGFDWWGHSVMGGKLVIVEREICLEIENSWTPTWGDRGYGVLRGSHKIPSKSCGCFAPRVISFTSQA
jgi:hypothetical protein